MFQKLSTITRRRVSDTRNHEKGLCLNRAERVEPFSKDIIEKLSSFCTYQLGNYYDITPFYSKLEYYLKVNINNINEDIYKIESLFNQFNSKNKSKYQYGLLLFIFLNDVFNTK